MGYTGIEGGWSARVASSGDPTSHGTGQDTCRHGMAKVAYGLGAVAMAGKVAVLALQSLVEDAPE